VPFCTELCWYCACHTAAVNRDDSLEAYARALAMKDIGINRASMDVQERKPSSDRRG
jgi:oxygen-independent coproporphyrinogen-3 oxidase